MFLFWILGRSNRNDIACVCVNWFTLSKVLCLFVFQYLYICLPHVGCKNNIIISRPEKGYITHTSRWLYAWHLASNALYFSVAEKSAYSVLQIFTSRAHEYYYYYYCYYYKHTDYSDPVTQMLQEHFMKWSVSEMWVFTAWTAFCGASVLYLNCLYHVPSVLWRCWLGGRKGIWPVKKLSGGVLAWLSVWSEVHCRLAYGPADTIATHSLLLQ